MNENHEAFAGLSQAGLRRHKRFDQLSRRPLAGVGEQLECYLGDFVETPERLVFDGVAANNRMMGVPMKDVGVLPRAKQTIALYGSSIVHSTNRRIYKLGCPLQVLAPRSVDGFEQDVP
jgi:hypothetical protein